MTARATSIRCHPKNTGVHARFKRNWITNHRSAICRSFPLSVEITKAREKPIRPKRRVQTGPKSPFGGVPGGRSSMAYQSLIEPKVTNPLAFPTTSTRRMQRSAFFQNFMVFFKNKAEAKKLQRVLKSSSCPDHNATRLHPQVKREPHHVLCRIPGSTPRAKMSPSCAPPLEQPSTGTPLPLPHHRSYTGSGSMSSRSANRVPSTAKLEAGQE